MNSVQHLLCEMRQLAGVSVDVNAQNPSYFDSQHLFDEIQRLEEMSLANPQHSSYVQRYSSALEWFLKNQVHAILVGGAAVVNWMNGGRNLDQTDMDFMVADLNAVKQKLREDGIEWKPLAGEEGRYGGVNIPEFDADILDAKAGATQLNMFALSPQGHKMQQVGSSVQFPVIEPHILAIMKLNNQRDKDMDDAFKLMMQPGLLNRDQWRNTVKAVRQSLQDAESIMSYKDMIPEAGRKQTKQQPTGYYGDDADDDYDY